MTYTIYKLDCNTPKMKLWVNSPGVKRWTLEGENENYEVIVYETFYTEWEAIERKTHLQEQAQ